MLRVVALPLILCIVVAIVYTFEKRGKTPDKANTHAKGNLFFVTFFCCTSHAPHLDNMCILYLSFQQLTLSGAA